MQCFSPNLVFFKLVVSLPFRCDDDPRTMCRPVSLACDVIDRTLTLAFHEPVDVGVPGVPVLPKTDGPCVVQSVRLQALLVGQVNTAVQCSAEIVLYSGSLQIIPALLRSTCAVRQERLARLTSAA